jgi:hypothetical protein
MTTKTKKKLCWNCEGRVGFDEEHCPFCGVYLSPTSIPGESGQDSVEEQPPHPPYDLDGEYDQGAVIDPQHSEESHLSGTHKKDSAGVVLSSNDELRKMLMPMGMLLSGSIFFLFGLVLLLFSKDGKLTLQWSGDYWYAYLGISLAMLFWGWRSLQFVDD